MENPPQPHNPAGPDMTTPGNPTEDPNAPKVSTLINSRSYEQTKKSKLIIKFLVILIVVLLVMGGAALLYNQNKKRAATKTFNQLTGQIKQHEINNALNYVGISNSLGRLIAAGRNALDKSDDSSLNALNKEYQALDDKVKKVCDQRANDFDKNQIDQKIKGLALTADQKGYLNAKKDVLNSLSSTQFSTAVACKDGGLISNLYKNTIDITGGLVSLTQLEKDPSTADSQLAKLKKFETFTINGSDDLKSRFPETSKLMNDLIQLLAYSYKTLNALKTGNVQAAQDYSNKLDAYTRKIDGDQANSDNEFRSEDDKYYNATVEASNKEIALSQKYKHFNDVGTDLPSFRIMDAALSKYSAAHDQSYPAGKSAKDVVNVTGDTNLKNLDAKGLLSGFSYSSIGSKRYGYTLSVKLPDGTKLAIDYEPEISNSL